MLFPLQNANSILANLPATEQQFLLAQADLILQKSSGTLEDLCQHVANLFSDKNYGWEEAIHDGKWYRYPSEVKHQRFCSEEALKNYLILKVLGIDVEYCLLENYQGTAMAHEIVLIPTETSTYLIDWQTVSPVTIEPEAFILPNNKIPFKTLHRLPQEEVLDRILSLRSGERFLDAIECEQILYIKNTPQGELQATIHYFSEEQFLESTFIFTRYTGGMNFYLRHETGVDADNQIYAAQEFGLCEVSHRETTKEYPLLTCKNGTIADLTAQLGFFQNLSTQQQRNICMESMYGQLSSDNDAIDGKFVSSKEDNHQHLMLWQETLTQDIPQEIKEVLQSYLTIYNTLQKENPYAAEKFLDFQSSKIAFDHLFPTPQDIREHYWKQYGTNPFWTSTFYISCALRDLGEAFSSTGTFHTSNIVTQELCTKTGIAFKPCTFSQLFEIVERFSTLNLQELYHKQENTISAPKPF